MRFELIRLPGTNATVRLASGLLVLPVNSPLERTTLVRGLQTTLSAESDEDTLHVEISVGGEPFVISARVASLLAAAIGPTDPVLTQRSILFAGGRDTRAVLSSTTVAIALAALNDLVSMPVESMRPHPVATSRLREVKIERALHDTEALELEHFLLELQINLGHRITELGSDESNARSLLAGQVRRELCTLAELHGMRFEPARLVPELRAWVDHGGSHTGFTEPSPLIAAVRVRERCHQHRAVTSVGGLPIIAGDPVRNCSMDLQRRVLQVLATEGADELQIVYITERATDVAAMLEADGLPFTSVYVDALHR